MVGVIKSSKLAGEEENLEGLLIPLHTEHEDSGIDSGDEHRTARAQQLDDALVQLNETSSSDEDLMVKPSWVKFGKKFQDNQLEGDEACHEPDDALRPIMPWQGRLHDRRSDKCDRSSPPLYEVELTASDEDDDTSVLELVIPMQNSRYKRLPTSSPTKTKIRFPAMFCCFLCCYHRFSLEKR